MKTRTFVFTVVAALVALLTFSGSGFAARKVCDDGTFPPCDKDGGGGGGAAPDYGDLIILYRDTDGVPWPSEAVMVQDPETGALVDGGLCWQPIAFNVSDEDGTTCPSSCVDDGPFPLDPDVVVVDVNQYNCGVAEGCSGCTQEVEFGRINAARSPDDVFDRQLEDVIVNLATADCVTLDPAGRLVASRVVDDVVSTSTIDSPLQNLAISRQLLLTGTIGAPLPEGASVLDTAARGIGAGSGKTGEVNVDLVAYLNQITGLTDPATSTILDPKLCETYREEVQGLIQLVEKCFLDYNSYTYARLTNFGTLPSPAYIPEVAPVEGWFEYLSLVAGSVDPYLFEIQQGPTTTVVFADEPGFLDGNIGGFAQAADDTRAVINFMHDWPIPDADVYATTVPCVDSGDIAYDVSISEESGLQVPKQMVDGGDGREFTVTVTNESASTDPATGTVTVTAIADAGGPIEGSPWVFDFTDLAVGASEGFIQPFAVDLGQRTTINWTALAAAPDDVNLSNNTATAVTNVKVTGGGGGGGGGNGGQGGNPN